MITDNIDDVIVSFIFLDDTITITSGFRKISHVCVY